MTQQCRGQRNITILILFSSCPLISCQCLPWQTTRQPLMQTWGPISQGTENRWGEWIWEANRKCPLQMMTVRDVKAVIVLWTNAGYTWLINIWSLFPKLKALGSRASVNKNTLRIWRVNFTVQISSLGCDHSNPCLCVKDPGPRLIGDSEGKPTWSHWLALS